MVAQHDPEYFDRFRSEHYDVAVVNREANKTAWRTTASKVDVAEAAEGQTSDPFEDSESGGALSTGDRHGVAISGTPSGHDKAILCTEQEVKDYDRLSAIDKVRKCYM